MQENRFDVCKRNEPTGAWIYLGSFRTREAGERFVDDIKAKNPESTIEFWVQVGGGQDKPLWFDEPAEEPRVKVASGKGKKGKDEQEPI